ncbi:MAG: SsrA-binding protein SmpB [Halothiobacillaceae bacterium]|nr:SsrA-binding protein SmpB [Halothiobacillaceae bacterium]HER35157.1 SsrA-binding protein SmpB [Halothiobacillaceae bacterium]
MSQNKKSTTGQSTIALNKKAKFDFFLGDRIEAGLVLEGWEVKALRDGKAQIAEAHVIIKDGEAWLLGAVITPLLQASSHVRPDPTRTRKLLLHEHELARLIGQVERKGFTIVPTAMYFKRGMAKLEIAIGEGKKAHDKRATIKDRDWQRDKQRIVRHSL